MIISRNNRFSMGRYRSLLIAAAVALSAASAFADKGCWTRVRFQKTNGGKDLQLSEFALYNWQGERVNSPSARHPAMSRTGFLVTDRSTIYTRDCRTCSTTVLAQRCFGRPTLR